MGTTVALPHRLLLDIDNTALNLTAEQESRILDVLPWRASYMRAFAEGRYRVSGMDLCGKASTYAGRYARSRQTVVDRAESLGIPLVKVRGRHSAKSIWSWDALLVFLGGCEEQLSAKAWDALLVFLGRCEGQFSATAVRALVTQMNQASPATRQARSVTLAQHGGAALLMQLLGAGLRIGPGRRQRRRNGAVHSLGSFGYPSGASARVLSTGTTAITSRHTSATACARPA